MNQSIVFGWLSRALSIIASIAVLPIIVSVIGPSGYAAYATILSFGAWIALLSLGLPISFQNRLSKVRNNDKLFNLLLSNFNGAGILLLFAGIPLMWLLSAVVYPIFAPKLSGISYFTLSILFCCLYINASSQIFINVQYGLHRPFWPNIYPAFNSILLLVAASLAKIVHINEINIAISMLALSSVIVPAHSCLFVNKIVLPQFNIKRLMPYIAKSRHNLIFAFLSAVTLSADYFIMIFILQPVQVLQYSIASKIFMSIFAFVNIILLNKWSPLSDLMHQSNARKARSMIKRILLNSLGLTLCIGLPLVGASPFLFAKLSSNNVINIGYLLPACALLYVLVRVWTDSFAMVLLCFNKARFLNKIVPVQALVSIAMQLILGRLFGAPGIFAGLTISFILTVSWLLPVESISVLNEL